MQHQLHTLKNGLRVVLAPMREPETATVIVMTGTGSRYENEHENGLAHFLEHMFFKGTKIRPTAKTISEELDGVGSIYNAFTAKERTAYFAKVASRYLPTALDVITDIFLNSTLPSREIAKERGAIIQEIGMYEDMPIRSISNLFDELIFNKEHPLGRTILGPKENIISFTRTQFSTYLHRNYVPANTVVSVAGMFDEKKILKKIEGEFNALPHGNPPHYMTFASEQNRSRVAIKEKQTDQTQLMLGVPSYPYLHKDEFALEVLTAILGSGMSSRLFLEVRERQGLAYFVRASAERYPDTGYFVVQAGVDHAKLEKTVETILGEFRKIKRTEVPAGELIKAKAHIKGTAALELETSDQIAEHAASSLINLGRVRTLEEICKGIDAVSAGDVQRVARDLLQTSKLNLAIIGPHLNKDGLVGMLRI